GVDLDGEFGLDAEALSAVPVPLLDAALGITSVAAHIPLALGASKARLGIGAADDAHHKIAWDKAGLRRRSHHFSERFMAEDQTVFARRRRAMGARKDFAVGPTRSERERADQNGTVLRRWFGDVIEPCRVGDAGGDSNCAHSLSRICLGCPRSQRCFDVYAGATKKFHRLNEKR